MDAEPVSLTLAARPIRALFLATDRLEVFQAVRLYTHLWGGAANAILPLPSIEEEIERFARAVRRFDPDILLTSVAEIVGPLSHLIADLPYPIRQVTDEQLDRYVEGREPLVLLGGEATHPAALLKPDFPVRAAEPSNIRIPEPGTRFEFELALHYGAPSEVYARYLRHHLGGRVLRTPDGPEELLKSLLVSSQRVTPASLSLHATRTSSTYNLMSTSEATPLESERVESGRTLFLFLAGPDEAETACACWNSRRVSMHANKYLLPRQLFLQSIPLCFELLAVPQSFDAVVVFASVPPDAATHIHDTIQSHLAARGASVPVAVYHRGFAYEMWQGGVFWGPAAASTRIINADTSLVFAPAAPPAHARSGSVFGFDAEIQLATGTELSLPRTRLTTRLLLNSGERLRRARDNEGGAGDLWLLRTRGVRARPGGLAGFTAPGKEVRIYLHPEDMLIREVLLHRGIRVQPNKHTRYARGFIRRFGGVEKTLELIRAGGGHIVGAFLRQRGEEGGLSPQRIASHVCARLGCDTPAANLLVREHLPRLVAAGLVRRGLPLKCPHCDLNDWYPVEDLSEFVECAGCAESFQLSGDGIRYSYAANELARRFVQEGGHAVLMAASVLRRMDRSAAIAFGGELFWGDERQNFAECDLFWLPGDHLVPVECKAYERLEPAQIREIEASMRNTIAVATALGAPAVLLGLLTTDPAPELFRVLGLFAEQAAEKGIGVHMILNGLFHPWCGADGMAPDMADVKSLTGAAADAPSEGNHAGELAPGYGVGSLSGPVDRDTLDAWEADLMV